MTKPCIAKMSKTTNDGCCPARLCNIPQGETAMKAFWLLAAVAMTAPACPASAFEISSPAVGGDGTIPLKHTANAFGCMGENISLPLMWKDVPADAKGLALTMYDPDAPTGSGFWHWLVVNIPVSTTELPEG